eukprot:SAG31_NODE_25502_length_460_cov_0.689751_1_plen_106_part_10
MRIGKRPLGSYPGPRTERGVQPQVAAVVDRAPSGAHSNSEQSGGENSISEQSREKIYPAGFGEPPLPGRGIFVPTLAHLPQPSARGAAAASRRAFPAGRRRRRKAA